MADEPETVADHGVVLRSDPSSAAESENTNDVATDSDLSPYIYALGRVRVEFPEPSLEREFRQVVGQRDTRGKTDRQVLSDLIAERSNRYIARQLCWIFTVQEVPIYRLVPRDPADLDLLIEALQQIDGTSISLVIGIRAGVAPPEQCGGLALSVLAFDQLYTFTRRSLVEALPLPEDVNEDGQTQFREAAEELFGRFLDTVDNTGALDEHRALNYSLVRYHQMYTQTAKAHREEKSLAKIEIRQSALSRDIMDVILSYTHRRTGIDEKWRFSVNVAGMFPYLVQKISLYFER